MSPTEDEALHQELVALSGELRHARRERAVEQTFNRYLHNPIDDVRATRIATLAADALTAQPSWVIAHVRYLYDNNQLTSTEPTELATRIITIAAHYDLHGRLPTTWPAPAVPVLELAGPGIEFG